MKHFFSGQIKRTYREKRIAQVRHTSARQRWLRRTADPRVTKSCPFGKPGNHRNDMFYKQKVQMCASWDDAWILKSARNQWFLNVLVVSRCS